MENCSKILLVEDNAGYAEQIHSVLHAQNYEISHFSSDAIKPEEIDEGTYDCILLGGILQQGNGFAFARMVKANPAYRDIPLILILEQSQPEELRNLVGEGALDFILRPFHKEELLFRVHNQLELLSARRKLEEMNVALNRELLKGMEMEESLRKSEQELWDANEKLDRLARTDPLTSLSNRRSMRERIEYEQTRNIRENRKASLIMCDIDNFKRFNDNHGHDCGDYVLIQTAQIISDNLRKQDTIARWGGEEFLALLPETDIIGAAETAERIRMQIENREFSYQDKLLHITLTLGVSICDYNHPIEESIHKADMALYLGKEQGRNRVIKATAVSASE